ncbi:hypothetical protein HAT2_00616 [Candidatus Similichlamydia laticola]|uniref:Uncharacterized protein n=1 Tax=Candidatus Similichlamydia laticola TaxID=2170265 RepID=A0A369KBI5_9BACT|nr:hypothetical protein HAT2_00616 [Candidatus Similichlamydia laticola]
MTQEEQEPEVDSKKWAEIEKRCEEVLLRERFRCSQERRRRYRF